MRQIQADAGRAARLAGDLLVFSGRDPAPPGETDLNTVLASTHDLLQASVGPRIDVRLATPSGLPTDMPGSALLEQVLETKPGVRVMRMSGSASGTRAPAPVTSTGTPHIGKPITAMGLLEKVRAVLSATPAE